MAATRDTGIRYDGAFSGTRPRVALLIETSLAPGRDMLRGIAQYVREQGVAPADRRTDDTGDGDTCGAGWSIYHEPRSLEQTVPAWLKRWDGDGIIARIQNRRIARAIANVDVPTVDVLGVVEQTGFPLVHLDDQRVGQMGVEHLIERGFGRFVFVGIESENWSMRRRDAFVEAAERAGAMGQMIDLPRRTNRSESWDRQEDRLAAWVAKLPKPVGVMLATDQLGAAFMEACRRAGAVVPDEVGVIGVDNDEPLCLVCDPPLTSIWPRYERVGYQAAKLLDGWMRGRAPSGRPQYIPPDQIKPRMSTDVVATSDRLVAEAVRFIRQHACAGITVDDVVAQLPVCRSILQRRFRAALHRTVHQQILSVRLGRARELLSATDLPLADIAERAGFRHQQYMGQMFRERLNTTPARYRRTHRGDEA
ncbi:DNA-binding transcriptional regulator [Planctomycetales bacterium ZRK34]|nr:DNA-binding transcriptional regulator [Planctomycetales bacterium ZRK34]